MTTDASLTSRCWRCWQLIEVRDAIAHLAVCAPDAVASVRQAIVRGQDAAGRLCPICATPLQDIRAPGAVQPLWWCPRCADCVEVGR